MIQSRQQMHLPPFHFEHFPFLHAFFLLEISNRPSGLSFKSIPMDLAMMTSGTFCT